MPDLVPIRYGRMLTSPFAFLRGSAAVMARDLASTPTSGIRVQACGDCHLANFGLFATPERNLVFDLNDFDETLPAPWEWDIKRLAASFVVVGRENGIAETAVRRSCASWQAPIARTCRSSPRCACSTPGMPRLDDQMLIATAPDAEVRQRREGDHGQGARFGGRVPVPEDQQGGDGRRKLIDQPPLVFHSTAHGEEQEATIEES